jgi:hypothetical protein
VGTVSLSRVWWGWLSQEAQEVEIIQWCRLPLRRLPRKRLLPRTQHSMGMRKCQLQRSIWKIAMMIAGWGEG